MPDPRPRRLYGRYANRLLDSAPGYLRQRSGVNQSENCMGKGDIKSRRGKIYRGSFGKSRPKDPPAKKKAAAAKALGRK